MHRFSATLPAVILGASLVSSCSTVFSSKEADHCEKALKVLVETSRTRDPFKVDNTAQSPREIEGVRVTDVTLTYIQNNTRKLVSCYYKPKTTIAVGYTFEGQRISDADTAAVNRRI